MQNLDPEGLSSDVDIWQALESAQCKTFVESLPDKLDYEISSGGQSISKGTRQLLALARALCKFITRPHFFYNLTNSTVRKRSILCLDEASASLDKATDICKLSLLPPKLN